MKPCRFEGEVQNLEIYGDLPWDIDGTFFRVMPDPQAFPFVEDDPVSMLPWDSVPILTIGSGLMAMVMSVPSGSRMAKSRGSNDSSALRNLCEKEKPVRL